MMKQDSWRAGRFAVLGLATALSAGAGCAPRRAPIASVIPVATPADTTPLTATPAAQDVAARDAASRFLDASPEGRRAAGYRISDLLDTAPIAPQPLADSLQDALLGTLLTGTPFTNSADVYHVERMRARLGDSVFIQIPLASATLRAKWSTHGHVISEAEWRPPTDGMRMTLYQIEDVRASGPLARIQYTFGFRTGTAMAPSRDAYWTRATVDLVRSPDGTWVIAAMNGWST